ncbi:E3 ubiquitin/ISG15 ligase TRIM25-like [Mixophyes fleayi]|uniref:E3 ubiquitin/ISG15 ligase TRIM25-like n=1 Tax=Mixophyes fleayi TaxID=3061075 RepID=UPI003F4DDA74
MASADLRQELDCSICLNIYTDPVNLRCGHNFCRVCIDRVLDTQEGSGVYTCPECRAECQERPALQRNITLCNIVGSFLYTRPDQKETGIFCTYCVDSPVPASKSCLMCEASLCDKHLRVHSKSAEHVLFDPTTSLGNKKCSVHKKILEYYCTEDAVCICVSCSLAGKHRGHQVEMLDEASEKKKEKLRNVLQKLTTKREETEKRVQSLQERRREDQEKGAGVTETVTALFRDIRRQLENLEKRVLSEISRQEENVSLLVFNLIQQLEIKKDELSRKMRHIEELCNMSDPVTVLQEPDTGDLCDIVDIEIRDKQVHGVGGLDLENIGDTRWRWSEISRQEKRISLSVSDLIQQLEIKKDELSRKMRHIEELCNMSDPVTVLQEPDTGDLCDTEDRKRHDDQVHGVGGLDVGLISGKLHTLSDIITGINTGIYVQEPTDILLDVNTAANNIHISDDRKTASWSDINQNHPETPERFQYDQVISTRRFSSGRHYWEVDVSKSVSWRVGMCYPRIDRREDQSNIGRNNKSWCMRRYNNQYTARHDSKGIQLPDNIPYDRVRIYLDYEAGQLSFYSLCDPIRHLHTITATFTEPLHAALCVWGGCIKISGGVRKWKK